MLMFSHFSRGCDHVVHQAIGSVNFLVRRISKEIRGVVSHAHGSPQRCHVPLQLDLSTKGVIKRLSKRFTTDVAKVNNLKDDAILIALTKGVDLDSDFSYWLERKHPSILESFYVKVAQYLRKEEAKRSKKKGIVGPSIDGVQSNMEVK